MLLTVSIGNSHTAFAVHAAAGPGRRAGFRLHTDARRTVDELQHWVSDLLARDGLVPADISSACMCSVVPNATAAVEALCGSMFGVAPLVVRPGVRTGLAVRYQPESSLGADRLIDAVAAHARFGAPTIAVDFGTATTINVVDASGTFIGGAIAPGIGIAAEALAEAGARLALVDIQGAAPPLVGRTTESAVQSGIINGHAALVDGLLDAMTAELTQARKADIALAEASARIADFALAEASARISVPVVATGGWAAVIAPLVTRIDHVQPGLIHDGLRQVWERHVHHGRVAVQGATP